MIEGKSGIPQVFHMKDSIDLGHEFYTSYNILIPHIPKCAIEKLGSQFRECRLCFFYKPLLYALWSVCFTGRFMKVDQRYVWCHWGELFFALEGGQCVGDATPGFARTGERTHEFEEWCPCLRDSVSGSESRKLERDAC